LPWPQLRERLRARLGDEAVYRVAPAGDPRPERSWRRDDGRVSPQVSLPPRPTWLLQKPVPLRGHDLRIVSGPERLESGWWDGEDARRDYYVVETAQGQRAWAFARVGERENWMLHGWFA
jgi:protein ImuB